jgi:hypothetical protein
MVIIKVWKVIFLGKFLDVLLGDLYLRHFPPIRHQAMILRKIAFANSSQVHYFLITSI